MGRSVNRYSDVVAYMTYEPECSCEYNEETGEHTYKDIWECEGDCNHFEWEYFVEWTVERILEKYPSCESVENEWIDNEGRIIAENKHAWFVLSEYCGCVSLSVVSRSDYLMEHGYDGRLSTLADAWCNMIASSFDKTFSTMNKIATMSNGEALYERKTA